MCVCGDFKVTLNPVLEVDQFALPRIEDIFAALSGGVQFSKVDFKHAYLQMEVAEDSRPLMTINTEKGLYQYNRLVYGVAYAPAIWQGSTEMVLQGIPGVKCIVDDMIITGIDDAENLEKLDAVLGRLAEYGLSVNLDKCQFFKNKNSFCGHEIDRHGLQNTQKKIETVVNAPQPTNVSELRSYVGIVNYYAHFIPNLSSVLHPLYNLHWRRVESGVGQETLMRPSKLLKSSLHQMKYLPIIIQTYLCVYRRLSLWSWSRFEPHYAKW